jgi:WD40 repeat protein
VIRLLDIETRQAIGAPLEGHSGAVISLVFSRDGRTLASGGDDNTVRLWDVQTGKPPGATR